MEQEKGLLSNIFGGVADGLSAFLSGINIALESLKEPIETIKHSKNDAPHM